MALVSAGLGDHGGMDGPVAHRTSSTLPVTIAGRIVDLARERDLAAGAHLAETALAAELGVSRSPVREALRLLESMGVVEARPQRGCFLRQPGASLKPVRQRLTHEVDEAPYLRIAADRLAGALPERVTEAQLMRRYGVSRGELQGMLMRIAEEGWIARRHGYGWTFLPILASPEALQETYRFRIALEPAALLEPSYRIDREAFARRRVEQKELVDGRIREISATELFELGARFHETVVGCSGNSFFLEAIQRINRLRRLIEYRVGAKTELFVGQAREHLEILDRLESGDQDAAAELMRRHLEAVCFIKFRLLSSGLEPSGSSRARRRAPGTAAPVARAHF